jgi:hypothetical protein
MIDVATSRSWLGTKSTIGTVPVGCVAPSQVSALSPRFRRVATGSG